MLSTPPLTDSSTVEWGGTCSCKNAFTTRSSSPSSRLRSRLAGDDDGDDDDDNNSAVCPRNATLRSRNKEKDLHLHAKRRAIIRPARIGVHHNTTTPQHQNTTTPQHHNTTTARQQSTSSHQHHHQEHDVSVRYVYDVTRSKVTSNQRSNPLTFPTVKNGSRKSKSQTADGRRRGGVARRCCSSSQTHHPVWLP